MVKRGKRGLSEVVSIVLILALVVVLVGIVWAVINNLVEENISQSESCFGIYGKVTLNNDYTCYNSGTNELQFSISVGDVNLNEVLVGISASGTSSSFRISNTATNIPNVVNYPDRSTNIKLPGKNSGLTYIFSLSGAGLTGPADSIRVAPIVGNDQCEVSDAMEEIDNCLSLPP